MPTTEASASSPSAPPAADEAGLTDPADSPRLPARYYLNLIELATADPTRRATLTRLLGIEPDQCGDPLATVRLDAVERMLSSLRRAGLPPEFGLQLGLSISPQDHHLLGLALLEARSVEEALRVAGRYFALLSPGFRLRIHTQPRSCRIEIIPWLGFSTGALQLHLDVVLAAFRSMLLALAGPPLPGAEVRASWQRPPHAAHYRVLLPWRIRFEATARAGFEIDLPRAWLDTPRRKANPDALAVALSRCAALIDHVRTQARLADWTAMMLQAVTTPPGIDELASLAGMSARTLRRHLDQEGRSFRRLKLEARMQRALESLEQGLPIGEVAQSCGYSDAANFCRAFRGVHGHPPSQSTARRR